MHKQRCAQQNTEQGFKVRPIHWKDTGTCAAVTTTFRDGNFGLGNGFLLSSHVKKFTTEIGQNDLLKQRKKYKGFSIVMKMLVPVKQVILPCQ